jgi:hypothetical protein
MDHRLRPIRRVGGVVSLRSVLAKSRLQRYGRYGVVCFPIPSHPIPPTPTPHHTPPHPIPPQARGDAVLIPSNAVGDAWVRRALLKVRVTTYYLLPTNHYSSHVLVLATYCMYWYLLPRVVSLSRLRCLCSSSCRSISAAYKCSSRTSTSL